MISGLLRKLRTTYQNYEANRSYQVVSRLFLSGLGAISLIAMLSFWVQFEGLVGSDGILPVQNYLNRIAEQIGTQGYLRFPTIFWISSADIAIHVALGIGTLASLTLIFNVAPAFSAFCIWVIYLSVCVGGQVFMQYQWDNLLIETTFIAIFLAPWQLWSGGQRRRVNMLSIWLLRLLLFKLIFQSGIVKLASGDPAWSQFTALQFHFLTQPLPTIFGWGMHQLPNWILNAATALALIIEVAIPFLIFTTRRLRRWAAIIIGGLMILIGITGNYGFFNLLGLLLCLSLFDDEGLKEWTRRLFRRDVAHDKIAQQEELPAENSVLKTYCIYGYVAVYLLVSLAQMGPMSGTFTIPEWGSQINRSIQSFRTINNYGLFANMTTKRPEIVIQGSRNGREWRSYRFKYKPGIRDQAPPWVQPHMPRLDWQMWFAALGNYRRNPWFVQFARCLLEEKTPVLNLLAENPFPNSPPRYIRAVQYSYEFNTIAEWNTSGRWWSRSNPQMYLPPISLKQFR